LTDKYQAEAEFFQFPVDKQIYNIDMKRVKTNKNIIFFAKPEMNRRCYEIGVMALRELYHLRSDTEIILFGSDYVNKSQLDFSATVLGLLPTISDLAELYRNADLGIVFSTTNPSLVPFEMLCCGCPVVDMDLEKAISKYGDLSDNIFLCSPEPKKMAEQINAILDNEELLALKSRKGREWVLNTFPTETEMARKIEKMIQNKIFKGNIAL
jgi:glycosyltransferase involved in cell wall biosynthesis